VYILDTLRDAKLYNYSSFWAVCVRGLVLPDTLWLPNVYIAKTKSVCTKSVSFFVQIDVLQCIQLYFAMYTLSRKLCTFWTLCDNQKCTFLRCFLKMSFFRVHFLTTQGIHCDYSKCWRNNTHYFRTEFITPMYTIVLRNVYFEPKIVYILDTLRQPKVYIFTLFFENVLFSRTLFDYSRYTLRLLKVLAK